MSLTRKDVEHVAHLARLRVDAAELDGVTDKLGRILDFVDQLTAVDTSGIAPMAHPLDVAQRLRPDEVTEPDQRDLYQRNAAGALHGLYTVPRVIE
jgi:aspartyl-tRNA(Asn)/glutamyl-tRNA(Gln) amidotransferase subunit C